MLFPTVAFAVFFVVAFTTSWLLRPTYRAWLWVMTGLSFVFYGWTDARFVWLLLALRVYIGGDSVVRDAGESFLRLAAGDKRLRTALHYEIATGLSRPDHFDWPTTLDGDATALKPEIALLMFGGNDAQGIVGPDGQVYPEVDSPGWRAEYGRRVGAVMDSLLAKDRLLFWIGQPPMRDAGFDRRIAVINEVVIAQAEERPWVTFLDTRAVVGGADGGYVDRLPGIDEDLRQGDGIHLSRAGATTATAVLRRSAA